VILVIDTSDIACSLFTNEQWFNYRALAMGGLSGGW
jgi:hypothetical protein